MAEFVCDLDSSCAGEEEQADELELDLDDLYTQPAQPNPLDDSVRHLAVTPQPEHLKNVMEEQRAARQAATQRGRGVQLGLQGFAMEERFPACPTSPSSNTAAAARPPAPPTILLQLPNPPPPVMYPSEEYLTRFVMDVVNNHPTISKEDVINMALQTYHLAIHPSWIRHTLRECRAKGWLKKRDKFCRR